MSDLKTPTGKPASKVRRNLAGTLRPELRLRRLRRHPALRSLICETRVCVEDLVQPIFVHAGSEVRNPISSMPGVFQLSVDQLRDEIKQIQGLGIRAVLLFGIPDCKDNHGSRAWHAGGVVQRAIRLIKREAPEILVITDLCFCEYTSHGHCGVLVEDKLLGYDVDNDQTLVYLSEQAVSLAQAGSDVIAPSGMVDGMVAALRHHLDRAGFYNLPIMSYSVKYASSFYGPFRDAAQGAPQFGDRKSYQMDPANARESLREAEQDITENADIIMVKPAQTYLDIVYRIKNEYPEVPLAAYQVSGEYAMIKAAAASGWLDEKSAMQESLIAIKRAGADFIITYFAKDMAKLLQPNHAAVDV